MNRVERLYETDSSPEGFARGYLQLLGHVLAELDPSSIAEVIGVFLQARDRGSRIFFIGNGGSAATASHFANDFAIGSRSWSRPFRALSLTDNVPVLSAIGNDHGYEQVFAMQLRALMEEGDVVVAITASGNSPNVLRALEYAQEAGGVTVALTGFDGGAAARIARHRVHVPSLKGEYGPVEDAHVVLVHLFGNYLQLACRTGADETAAV